MSQEHRRFDLSKFVNLGKFTKKGSDYSRWLTLTLTLVAIVVIYLLIFNPFRRPNPLQLAQQKKPNLRQLYKKAMQAIGKNDLGKASEYLQRIVVADPNYKDAKVKLAEVVKKNLYQKAKKALAANDLNLAKKYLDELNNFDPNYRDVPELRKQIEQGINPDTEAPPGSNPGTGQNDNSNPNSENDSQDPSNSNPNSGDNNNQSPPAPSGLPLLLLPEDMEGYRLLQRGWVIEPDEANAAYRSRDRDARRNIDMAIVTVAKYNTASEAQYRLAREEQTYSTRGQILTVNQHEAYFGQYFSKDFPHDASLMWTNRSWFFSVTVLPKQILEEDDPDKGVLPLSTLRNATLDVASKLAY